MNDFHPRNVDPRLLTRAAEFLRTKPNEILSGDPRLNPAYYPQAMPQAMPGPPGGGGYNRYREMTLEEMLLENRVVFLVGEINHVTASRVIMQMLYLQSVKRDQDINFYICPCTSKQAIAGWSIFMTLSNAPCDCSGIYKISARPILRVPGNAASSQFSWTSTRT